MANAMICINPVEASLDTIQYLPIFLLICLIIDTSHCKFSLQLHVSGGLLECHVDWPTCKIASARNDSLHGAIKIGLVLNNSRK